MFVLEPLYETIKYPERDTGSQFWSDDFIGFEIEVVTNYNGSQLNALRAVLAECQADKESDYPYRPFWKHVAKYVKGWNVQARNADTGELEPVPPPSVDPENNWQAFELLPFFLQIWVRDVIALAYLPKFLAGLKNPVYPETTEKSGETNQNQKPSGETSGTRGSTTQTGKTANSGRKRQKS